MAQASGVTTEARRRRGLVQRVRETVPRSGLLLALVILFVLLSLKAPYFLTTTNLFNVLRVVALNGMVACAMTFVIISGDIDVSVGSALAWSSALLGTLAITLRWPVALAVVTVLVVGTVIHILAALIRVKLNVPSFVVTLALFISLRGAAQMITGAWAIAPFPEGFSWLGQGYALGVIPLPAVFMAITFLVFYFVSVRTEFGRSVYAIGGNEEASRLSGIPVERTRISIYALTGLLAALSGVILSARINAGSSKIGDGFEFEVIAAVIIGGTSLSGGMGSIGGTLLGVLFIGLLTNGMVLMNVDPFAQQLARGLIILIAVIVGEGQKQLRRQRRSELPLADG